MKHPDHIRDECLRLMAAGQTYAQVSEQFGIPIDTLYAWSQRYAPPKPKRPKSEPGSGVIAPAPYFRGARWGAGL